MSVKKTVLFTQIEMKINAIKPYDYLFSVALTLLEIKFKQLCLNNIFY